MKVSPEYLIQLSHRVNTLHREKKEEFNEAQVKGQGEYFICILTGPGQRTG